MHFYSLSISYAVLTFSVFFKQKTAYEVRISDWSSDVCSSDLWPWPHDRERGRSRSLGKANRKNGRLRREARCAATAMACALALAVAAPAAAQKIGRASCRERGCQYV